MFTITSRNDVLTIAKTFGVAALDHIINNSTMSIEASHAIHSCRKWAASDVICIENFNDGNNVYEIEAHYKSEKVGGFYCTGIDDIHITRTGNGSFVHTLRDAMANKEISTEQCSKLIAEITARNEAAAILF